MQTRQMADVVFNLKEDAAYQVTKPAAVGPFVSEDEATGIYLTESDFSFQFLKRDGKFFLRRNGRNDVELEREADNIFHQKFDPAFKQEFARTTDGNLEVTAYYTTHAPYTLTKQNASFTGVDFESLNGIYLNAETDVSLTIRHASDKTYNVKMGTNDATKGLLVSPGKLLVNNYSMEFEALSSAITEIFLHGDRIKRVRFVRQNQ